MATLKNTTINDTGYIQLPVGNTSQRPSAANGMVRYNSESGKFETYAGGSWRTVTAANPGTADSPATSATSLKAALGASAVNGSYYYTLSSGTVQLYTDFTSYSNYPMVLVTKMSPNDQNQYLTTSNNISDLQSVTTNTTPSRSSKISDADMNYIIAANTIRWVIAGQYMTFYRLDDNPNWYSNHGVNQSCSYDRGFYDAFATPSNTPTWLTRSAGYFGAYESCGGAYDNTNNWLTLSGIHINDGVYMGAYSGASSYRGSTPSPYQTTAGGNSAWSQGGYVFLSW